MAIMVDEPGVIKELDEYLQTLTDYFYLVKDSIENATELAPNIKNFFPLEVSSLSTRVFTSNKVQGSYITAAARDAANRISAHNRECTMRMKTRADFYKDAELDLANHANYVDRITTRNKSYSKGISYNQGQ